VISLLRYAGAQSALMRETTNHELDRSRLARIEGTRALADSVEGMRLPRPLLRNLCSASGGIVNLDSLWGRNDDRPTLILLFSLLGCNACLNQELDIIESDSQMGDSGCRALYICTDSLDAEEKVNFARFQRARHLKMPTLRDSSDLVRRSLGLTAFSITELVVVNERILYATQPSSSDRDASLRFLKRLQRLMEPSRRAAS
jgi:hypothetical protein